MKEFTQERILEQVGSAAQYAYEQLGVTREELHQEIDEALEAIDGMPKDGAAEALEAIDEMPKDGAAGIADRP